ncbi:MAG: hypothetical protein ACRCX2_12660 [Paraclostridium sp.]
MAKQISCATCSDTFDFVITDSGDISVETETSRALANMLTLDFTSNDDWALDSKLGIHWFSKENDGLLQTKGSEAQIVSSIQRKLSGLDGIREVQKIEINRGVNRKLYVLVSIIADTGEEIILKKEVS